MTRKYKLFKIDDKGKSKHLRTYDNIFDPTKKVKQELGLYKFQKCQINNIYDGNLLIGNVFILDGKKIFEISKEINWQEGE